MALETSDKYTNSALRIGDVDTYPQRKVGEFIGTVVSNAAVNDEYWHVILKVHPHALTASAGQMFHLLCPSPDGAEVWMRRPMSVYRVDKANGQIEFLYKTEGRGTRGMGTLKPGDEFNIAGPLGHGFTLEPAWKNIVVLGRGVGLATLAISRIGGLGLYRQVSGFSGDDAAYLNLLLQSSLRGALVAGFVGGIGAVIVVGRSMSRTPDAAS